MIIIIMLRDYEKYLKIIYILYIYIHIYAFLIITTIYINIKILPSPIILVFHIFIYHNVDYCFDWIEIFLLF